MWQDVKITVRKFERTDIPKKVVWINNPENNQFLHYDIPISVAGTEKWFESHVNDTNRYDAVMEADGVPVGTIGLLNVDRKNSKAEFYIALGEITYKGKGVAQEASRLILSYGFEKLGLNRIYLYTEIDNIAAQKLFEKIGFIKEGIIRQDIVSHGKYVDRVAYGYLKEEWNR